MREQWIRIGCVSIESVELEERNGCIKVIIKNADETFRQQTRLLFDQMRTQEALTVETADAVFRAVIASIVSLGDDIPKFDPDNWGEEAWYASLRAGEEHTISLRLLEEDEEIRLP